MREMGGREAEVRRWVCTKNKRWKERLEVVSEGVKEGGASKSSTKKAKSSRFDVICSALFRALKISFYWGKDRGSVAGKGRPRAKIQPTRSVTVGKAASPFPLAIEPQSG